MQWTQSYDFEESEYRKYRKFYRISLGILFSSYAAAIGIVLIDEIQPTLLQDKRLVAGGPVLLILMGSFYLTTILRKRQRSSFSSVEHRTLFFLKPASKSLAAYIAHRSQASKKACLKNLRQTVKSIQSWSGGNLRFLQKNVGEKISQYKKGFRGILIPAVESGDESVLRRILGHLTALENGLLIGNIEEGNFDHWNSMFSELSKIGTFAEKKSVTQRLREPIVAYHAAYVLSVLAGAYTYFRYSRESLGASIDASLNGFNAILGIFLAPYVLYVVSKYLLGRGQ